MRLSLLLVCLGSTGCLQGPVDTFSQSESFRRELFAQGDALPSDILFVVDSSCSMEDEQEALAGNFPAFADFFVQEALEFRIAVTTTNVGEEDSEGLDGVFFGETWLDDSTEDLEQAFLELALVGIDSHHSDEVGLTAAWTALEDPPAPNVGFVRPGSHLAVVVVSDEPDWSTSEDGAEADVMHWPEFVQWLDGRQGAGNASLTDLSAIVGISEDGLDDAGGCGGSGGSGPTGLGAKRGDGYIEAASATGGSLASICDDDWGETLERIGLRAAGLSDAFPLAEEPEVETITVSVEGRDVADWYFRPFDNSIVFGSADAVPRPREEIQVSYHVVTAARE